MSLVELITWFSVLVTAYFLLWNLSQLATAVLAGLYLLYYQRRRRPRNLALAARLASPPLVSIIAPARNEELTIVESVKALLALDYEAREIVVVNDGSTDDTLRLMQDAFRMVQVPLAFEQPIRTARVRGTWRSIVEPTLVVIDKESGGCKADAINAGINAASGSLVLVIDADTILEPDALTRAVVPFLEDPSVIAVGGYVAIANGCRIEGGRVAEVAMPRAWLARFQVVEYMRSFLLFRLACAWMNAVSLISGAFGLFRRDALLNVGGFDPKAIGEDMDLTLRLQRFYRERRQPVRIGFVPLPICWTQAPEDRRSLGGQRSRWRRGLLQVLWSQRRALANPRLGMLGLGVLPYTLFFEGLGPLIELSGYVLTTVAALAGILALPHYLVLLAASVLLGAATTLAGVFLSDTATRQYPSNRDLAILVAASVLENVGYRQLNTWWSCVGTYEALRGKHGWGTMQRQAFKPN